MDLISEYVHIRIDLATDTWVFQKDRIEGLVSIERELGARLNARTIRTRDKLLAIRERKRVGVAKGSRLADTFHYLVGNAASRRPREIAQTAPSDHPNR